MVRKAATHLMFAGQASSALELYSSTFPSFRVERLERYAPGESGAEGSVKRAEASLSGHALLMIDSPGQHAFTFTPAMSLYVDCDSREELDSAFAALAAGGQIHMPLDNDGFSARFGWCSGRFGVSWQLNLPGKVDQRLHPTAVRVLAEPIAVTRPFNWMAEIWAIVEQDGSLRATDRGLLQ